VRRGAFELSLKRRASPQRKTKNKIWLNQKLKSLTTEDHRGTQRKPKNKTG
jgi:hypothetical protein